MTLLEKQLNLRPAATGREALRQQVIIGQEFQRLVGMDAWKWLYDDLLTVREVYIQTLVDNPSGGEAYAEAIRLVDGLLNIPEKKIREGKSSEIELGRMSNE